MAKTILVIDDDEAFLLAAQRVLELASYEALTARSSDDARRLLQEKNPDLILLDVLMPDEDGFTFAEKLAEDENQRDIPVVLVTSVADSPGAMMHAWEKNKALTVHDVLPKSDVHERLLDIVGEMIEE